MQNVNDNNLIQLHIHDLITNPTGKKSAYFASREVIKRDLELKYRSLLLKHERKFEYKVFKKDEDFIFHFKIPSTTFKDLNYDVIIDFYPENEECLDDKNLTRYLLRIFSNSPAFMFTYTYVCYKNNMIPREMIRFCSKEALNNAPEIRNPVEVYGYEKSIYFACLYIIENKLYMKNNLIKEIYKYKKDSFDGIIFSQEKKLIEYNKHKNDIKKKKVTRKIENKQKTTNAINKVQKGNIKRNITSKKKVSNRKHK